MKALKIEPGKAPERINVANELASLQSLVGGYIAVSYTHLRYGPDVPQANIDRLKYEIGVVKTMGYTNYYLIVWDYICLLYTSCRYGSAPGRTA